MWPFDQKQTLQILVGVSGSLILALVSQAWRRHEDLEEIKSAVSADAFRGQLVQVNAFFEALRQKGGFGERLLVWMLRSAQTAFRDGAMRLSAEQATEFWLDSIRECHRWWATSYVRPEQVWDRVFTKDGLAAQKERVECGAEIRRVFILDDDAEYGKLLPVMTAQMAAGIQVRSIKMLELQQDKVLIEQLKGLETLDFVYADDCWLMRNFLDKQRRLVGCEASQAETFLQKARSAFRELFAKATPL